MGAFFGTSRLEGAVLEATLWPDQDVVAKKVAVIGPRTGVHECWSNNRVMGDEWASVAEGPIG